MATMGTAVDDDGGEEWQKHVDEASGSAYYYNARTGGSSWEIPAGFKSLRAPDASQDRKAPQWREFVDEASGATYYYDAVSGASRWDKPEDFVREEKGEDQNNQETQEREESEEQEKEKQEEAVEVSEQEPRGGNEGEKTEHKEEEHLSSGGDKVESNEKEAEEAKEDNSTSAAAQHWVKYVDAASNKPYYYNANTGETQWGEPEDFDESAGATVPAGPQVSAEYQAHLNRMRTERLARATQLVLDPSGNLSKLNSILSGIDSNAPPAAATTMDGEAAADAPRTSKAEWQQHIDAQTQRYYYHNVVTGVTQWNEPDAPIVSGVSLQRVSYSMFRHTLVLGVLTLSCSWLIGSRLRFPSQIRLVQARKPSQV